METLDVQSGAFKFGVGVRSGVNGRQVGVRVSVEPLGTCTIAAKFVREFCRVPTWDCPSHQQGNRLCAGKGGRIVGRGHGAEGCDPVCKDDVQECVIKRT